MIRMHSYGKRSLAMVLAVLMLFSCINGGLYPFTAANAVEKESVTEGELLVNNYELDDAVKALLLSGLLNEETYVYEVSPTSDDGLVEVDGAKKSITAKIFERNGFVWYPKDAKVVSGDKTETVALKEDGGQYTGTFKTEGNTYSVQVTYELHIEVAADRQETLLNAGADLKTSLDSLDQLAMLVTMLDTKPADREETCKELIGRIMEGLLTWVNGVPVPVMPGTMFYYPGGFAPDEEDSAPIKALAEQMEKNNGNLDLFVMLEDYNKAASKTQYLMENGNALLAKAKETSAYLKQILAVKNTVLSMLDLGTGMGVDLGIAQEDMEDFYTSLNIVINGGEYAGVKFAGLDAVTAKEWAALTKNILKGDMTAVEYKVLDALVKEISATAPVVSINQNLLAASVSVQVNMNRFDIFVKVAANVIERNAYNDAELKNLVSDKTVKITLNKGATYAEVMDAIAASNVITNALADWADAYQVGDEFYTQTIIGMGAEDVVEADMTITFLYTPNTYAVTGVEGLPTSVPYGYNLVLPSFADPEGKRVYDYEIGGVSYRQGSVYRVVGDTAIIRTEGESWVDSSWGDAVAYAVSDKAAVVLKSDALVTGTLSIRYPSNKVISQKTDWGGITEVRALTADSGVEGLLWVPAHAYYVTDGVKNEITNFTADSVVGVGTFICMDYDKVLVEYELVLNGIISDAAMLALLNLPAELAKQALEQKEDMDGLAAMKGALDQLAGQINTLKFLLGTDMLTEEGKAALSVLVNDCYNIQTEKLFIQEYLESYEANGLAWYYAGTNFEDLEKEFNKLKKSMNDFLDATPDLKDLLNEFGYGDKYEMVDGVRTDLNNVKLLAPHSAINRTAGSNKLAELVAAIEGASADEVYTELPQILAKVDREQTAENKRSITVNMMANGKLSGTFNMVFLIGHTLNQDNIDKLNAAIADMNAALTIDKQFYDYIAAALPTVGTVIEENITLDFAYVPKTIDVIVDGVGVIDTFTVHTGDIVLPACGEEGMRYQYIINGQVVDTYNAAVTYGLNAEQKLFLLNGGTIIRKTVNISRQNLLNFVASLNSALASSGSIGAMSFIPVEDAQGNISIVLKVSPLAGNLNPQGILMNLMETIISSNYAYIDLGGYQLRTGTPMHIQGVIDALLDSGFSLTNVADAINSNGTINNMKLAGHTLVMDGIDLSMIPDHQKLGGKLIESQLDLATTENGMRTSVKLYITLGDTGANASTLSTLDKGLGIVTPYVNLHLVDGSANLVLNLPDKAYQAFLAAMMITGNTELGTINDLDYDLVVEYLYSLVEPVLWDETISTDSFENSLGNRVDLSAAQGVLSAIQKVLKHIKTNVEFSNEGAIGNIYHIDAAYPIDPILNRLPIPETLLSVIAEKGGKLEATFGVQLKNLDTDYEALIIDIKGNGLDKIDFVTDLDAALKGIHNYAVVILTADTDGNITTDKTIFLDLNGQTVNGDVIGSNITVIDSTIGNVGKVTGKITGSDIRYNNMYTIEADGDNINVYLNAARWALDEMPQFKNIAVDLALDLLLNYYTAAALKLDGDVIYSVDLGDVIGMIKSGAVSSINDIIDILDCEGLSNFSNKLMADLTDYAKLAEAAKNGDKLFSYTITTQAWNVSVSHNKEQDYITGGIVPSKTEKTKTLNVYLAGTDAQKKDLIELLTEMGKVLDVDIQVNLEDIYFEDRVFGVNAGASANILLDTKGNHDYGAALAILLASSRKDNAAIIDALETYFADGDFSGLKKIVDNTTIAQLFTAIKSVGRSTNFGAMVTKLGLNAEDAFNATKLMVTYRRFLLAASGALRALNVTGSGTKLSTFEVEGEPGAYDLSKELDRAGTIAIFGCDIELAASVKVVLFGVVPSFEGFAPTVTPGGSILGSKVDTENKLIILDVLPDGITLEEFMSAINHEAANADKVDKFVSGVADGLVVNGATVEFVASNRITAATDKVTYTVVILGDVNSDGRNSVSDAVALMTHVMQEADLNVKVGPYATLAADINCDGSLSVSDAVMIMRKCMYDHYVSVLN